MKSLFLESAAQLSDCGLYRYSLSRVWDQDKYTVTWIMLNPSTADAAQDDPTIRRCCGFAEAWGLGGIYVVNLFAFRATEPKRLRTAPDPIGPENDSAIIGACMAGNLTVAAWGTMGELRGRGEQVLAMLRGQRLTAHHLGLTQGGHPRHPLYARGDLHPVPFAD